MSKKIIVGCIILVFIILILNLWYYFCFSSNPDDSNVLVNNYEKIMFSDCKSDFIYIKEHEYNNQVRLIWDFSKEYSEEVFDENELYDLLTKAYIINTLVDGVNLSAYYDMDLLDAIYINTVWNKVEELSYIEDFVNSVIIRKCNIQVVDITKLESAILKRYKEKFEGFFGEKYTLEYFDEIADKYIGSELEQLSYVNMVQYVQLYEDYYSYYIPINQALHKRNEKEFIDNSEKLYYYVGEFSEEEVRNKYINLNSQSIENDLKDIIPNMVDMFRNYSCNKNQYLKTAVHAANEINYKNTTLFQTEKQTEYSLTDDDIEWGTNLFVEHMKKIIYK